MSLFKQNKNLRNYILEFLNKVDKIQFYILNSAWRDTEIYNYAYFSVFLYLQENMNFIYNEANYINRYHRQSLVKLTFTFFKEKFKEQDILNALVDFFNVQFDLLDKSKILLIFEDKEELELSIKIFERLNKKRFNYYLDEFDLNLINSSILPLTKELFLYVENLFLIKENNEIIDFLAKSNYNVKLNYQLKLNMQHNSLQSFVFKHQNTLQSISTEFKINNLNLIIEKNVESIETLNLVNDSSFPLNSLIKCSNLKILKINQSIINNENTSIISKLFNLKSLTIKDIKSPFFLDFDIPSLKSINGLVINQDNIDSSLFLLNRHSSINSITNVHFSENLIPEILNFFLNLNALKLEKISFLIPKDTALINFDLNKLLFKHQNLYYFKCKYYFVETYKKLSFLFKKFKVKSCFSVLESKLLTDSFAGFLVLLKNNPTQIGYNILTDDVTLLNDICSYLLENKEFELLLRFYVTFMAKEPIQQDYVKSLPILNSINLNSYFENVIPFLYCKVIRNIYISKIDENNKEILPFLNFKGITDINVGNDEEMFLIKHLSENVSAFLNLKYSSVYFGRYSLTYFDERLILNLLKFKKLCYLGIEVIYDSNYINNKELVEELKRIPGVNVLKAGY